MSNELWLNSNGTDPSCFQAHNRYFENTCIPVSVNISRGNMRIIVKDDVVLTCTLLSFQSQQGSFLRTISLIRNVFEHCQNTVKWSHFPNFACYSVCLHLRAFSKFVI
jgi:hypothetical protein